VLARLTGALVVACALLTALPAGAAAKLSRDAQKVYDDYRSDAAIQPCDHTVAVYRRTLREITPAVEEETPAFRPAVEAALRERNRGRRQCLAQDSPTQPGTSGGGSAPATSGGSTPPATQHAPAAPPGAPPATAPPSTGAPAHGAPAPATSAPAPVPQATPAPTVAPPPPVTSSAPAAPAEVVLLDHPHQGTPVGLLIALGLLALSALLTVLALLARHFGLGEERLAGSRHAWGEASYRAGATWADFVDWIRVGRGPHRL
jgi:hypothetical protein